MWSCDVDIARDGIERGIDLSIFMVVYHNIKIWFAGLGHVFGVSADSTRSRSERRRVVHLV